MEADQTLQYNASILLKTFDKISDYVFLMEVNGSAYRYVFVNEPGKRAINWSDADIGKRIDELVPAETANLITKYYDEAIKMKKSVIYEDYRLADSFYTDTVEADDVLTLPLHYFESEVTPIFNDEGTCTHIVSVVREVTDRKRRELELSILKDHHESLRRYSPHGIFVLDHHLNIKSVNPAVMTITGFTEQELLFQPFLQWLPKDEQSRVQKGLQFTLSGIPHKYSLRATHQSGERLDLSILNIPIEVGGNITGLFAIIIDLTPEKNAERATIESERRYRQLIETIPEGIIVHRGGRILYANAMALATIGETYLESESIFSFIAEEYHQSTRKRLASLEVGGPVQDTEMVVVTPSGDRLQMDISSLLIDYEGETAVLTILRDVTEKREMELALRQSELQYRLITENMSDLVCILGKDGTVRYASPSHRTVLGFSASYYEGKSIFDYIHSDDQPAFREQIRDMNKCDVPLTLEFRHFHADQRWIWLETKVQAIYSKSGHLLHYMTVSREIMQRKALEKQLKHLAYHDALTDLPNRRFFLAYLEEAMDRAEFEQRELAVLALDVDRFKQINDTFGHDVGDELLRQLARRLTSVLREQDMIARLGGDEFAVLIRFKDPSALHRVAEKVIQALQRPWEIDEHTFITTSSVGCARYVKGLSTTQLLKRADLALYEAKAGGRNQYVLAKDHS
ncbi:sensor domain-containing diguanylate cyclase [Exiguobacterium qingdaonense]|uniref:sensor domain-containing diguanylate cyclase n=1 Tax=Exiguobacterium qingdaonense TaxID=2751251 RepID=UPI001BE61B6A|nr:sensor domain-containing diguanylate cyclase [Exiguobacterium qingdaonense]